MKVKACAKINFFLHIVGKRADGYHNIESLACPIDLCDEIEFIKNKELSLDVTGEFASFAPVYDNIVLKAARLLQEHTKTTFGAHIKLTKNIPAGAGLGGGSSDAAATLRALSELWELSLSKNKIEEIAKALGSDVPFFLKDSAQIMEGTGHTLTPAKIPKNYYILIAYPNKPLSTKEVYGKYAGLIINKADKTVFEKGNFIDLLKATKNDLEVPAFLLMPELRELIFEIGKTKGCIIARMSGSGSACFGVYEEEGAIINAARTLQEKTNLFVYQARPVKAFEANVLE